MLKSQNLPLIAGKYPETVSRILALGDDTPDNMFENLCLLSCHVKVKVWFDSPVRILRTRYWRSNKEVTEAVIGRFFKGNNGWGYSVRHEGVRSGYAMDWIQHIIRYEPVLEGKQPRHEGFISLEKFSRKFDPRFISPELIKDLYGEKSCQTGRAYTPADFRQLGRRGKEVMKKFLEHFKGLNEETPFYHVSPYKSKDGSERKVLHEHYDSWHHAGRDIKIEHTLGSDRVFYSSEYYRCGNGRYGILATENTFLHLEDD